MAKKIAKEYYLIVDILDYDTILQELDDSSNVEGGD